MNKCHNVKLMQIMRTIQAIHKCCIAAPTTIVSHSHQHRNVYIQIVNKGNRFRFLLTNNIYTRA